MKKSIGLLAVGALLASIVALNGCGNNAASAASDSGITVSASSSTQVEPDKARINVAVNSQAKTADACREANARDVNKVIDALIAAGVAEENIQTEWTNLTPIQDYDEYSIIETAGTAKDNGADETSGAVTSPVIEDEIAPDDGDAVVSSNAAGTAGDSTDDREMSNVIGYEMYTSLSVEGISIEAVGAITADVVAAGATSVSGIQYYSSSYDDAYNAALAKALDEARSKAQFIAEASNVRLGEIVAVTEGYQDTGYRYAMNTMAYEEDTIGAGGALAKTMPGQIDITAQVTVRFAIA